MAMHLRGRHRPTRRRSRYIRVEALEARRLLNGSWYSYAGNPQHTALSPVPSQSLDRIAWQTPVDLAPQYNGSALLIHYGSPLVTPAQRHQASGGGTYYVMPGVLSEFQFSRSHVECNVRHAVLPDGTGFKMFMSSTDIDSVSIDSPAKTVTITGTMVSIVPLHFKDGTAVRLREVVPFHAFAEDNGTPGAGKDYFALTVVYNPDLPGLNQFHLFGSPATFAGVLASGNVVVR